MPRVTMRVDPALDVDGAAAHAGARARPAARRPRARRAARRRARLSRAAGERRRAGDEVPVLRARTMSSVGRASAGPAARLESIATSGLTRVATAGMKPARPSTRTSVASCCTWLALRFGTWPRFQTMNVRVNSMTGVAVLVHAGRLHAHDADLRAATSTRASRALRSSRRPCRLRRADAAAAPRPSRGSRRRSS